MTTEFSIECVVRFNKSILLSADSAAKLRKPDVYRVIEDYHHANGTACDLVEYLIEQRPDLGEEILMCKMEIEP